MVVRPFSFIIIIVVRPFFINYSGKTFFFFNNYSGKTFLFCNNYSGAIVFVMIIVQPFAGKFKPTHKIYRFYCHNF